MGSVLIKDRRWGQILVLFKTGQTAAFPLPSRTWVPRTGKKLTALCCRGSVGWVRCLNGCFGSLDPLLDDGLMALKACSKRRARRQPPRLLSEKTMVL